MNNNNNAAEQQSSLSNNSSDQSLLEEEDEEDDRLHDDNGLIGQQSEQITANDDNDVMEEEDINEENDDCDEEDNGEHSLHSLHMNHAQQQHLFETASQTTAVPSLQYQFKTENGQTGITYRVLTVDESQNQMMAPTIVAANATPQQHSSVALLTHTGNPFAGIATTQQLTTNATATDSTGPFYVMMTSGNSSQELMTATSTHSTRRTSHQRVQRDEKRRATHNEVERRRRDKINSWIIKLSKVVPDCQQDRTKQGQSKGGILAKATEYIQELRSENCRMNEILKENEILNNELDAIRSQLLQQKAENRELKRKLEKAERSAHTDNNNGGAFAGDE